MKKKTLAMLLALVMLASVLAGCASNAPAPLETPAESAASEAPGSEAPAPEAPVEEVPAEPEWQWPLDEAATITSFYPWSPRMVQLGYTDPNDFLFYPELEKRTNVHMEFQAVGVDAALEQFNLIIAGGDYPDCFYNCYDFYSGGGERAIEDEVWLDLAPYLDQYCPNYQTQLNSDPSYMKFVKLDNGAIPQFYSIMTNPYARSGKVIRADWLEALNLEVPDTNEELYEVAKAFHDEYGLADPMNGTNNPSDEVWPSDFYVEDGTVKYALLDKELTVPVWENKAKWYAEGLVSQETILESRTREDSFAMIFNGEIGSWDAELDMFFVFKNNAKDAGFKMTPLPLIKNSEGIAYGDVQDNPISNSVSISADCENLELVLRWFDYWYTDETILLANYGLEGDTFTYDDEGNPHFTDKVVNYEEGINLALLVFCMDYGPTVLDFNRRIDTYDDEQQEALKIWSDFTVNPYTYPRYVKYTTEEGDVKAAHLTDIETYIDETVPKIIFGEYDPNEIYDEFVSTLKELGIDELLAVYQSAYDRAVAK